MFWSAPIVEQTKGGLTTKVFCFFSTDYKEDEKKKKAKWSVGPTMHTLLNCWCWLKFQWSLLDGRSLAFLQHCCYSKWMFWSCSQGFPHSLYSLHLACEALFKKAYTVQMHLWVSVVMIWYSERRQILYQQHNIPCRSHLLLLCAIEHK